MTPEQKQRIAHEISKWPEAPAVQSDQSENTLEMVKRELFHAQQALLNEGQQRDKLLAALENIIAITNDSQGVAGYHLNGDIAEWGSFQEIAEAEAVIAEAKEVQRLRTIEAAARNLAKVKGRHNSEREEMLGMFRESITKLIADLAALDDKMKARES